MYLSKLTNLLVLIAKCICVAVHYAWQAAVCDRPIYIRDALIFNVGCMHAAGGSVAVKYIPFWMQAGQFFWMHFWIRVPGDALRR